VLEVYVACVACVLVVGVRATALQQQRAKGNIVVSLRAEQIRTGRIVARRRRYALEVRAIERQGVL